MKDAHASRPFSSLRRSLHEFLLVPGLVVACFLVLAVATDLLDHSDVAAVAHARDTISRHVFAKADRTSEVLSAIATGLVTMTSITVSVLLVALQQSSTNLTAQVFDQFVRRRQNQVFFGGFIGLAIYSLLVLASINDGFNPVVGATIDLALTVTALIAMVMLLYEVVNQMRPVEIITVIHDLALCARAKQRRLVARTRRRNELVSLPREVRATTNGFVTSVDVDALNAVAKKVDGEVELVVSIGSYVAMNDLLANVRGNALAGADAHRDGNADADGLRDAVRCAVAIARHRNLDCDAAFAMEQLQTIGWTAISSAKHSREAGLLCIRSTFDVLARWSEAPIEDAEKLAVVYPDDVVRELFETVEAFTVASAESMQSRCFAEVIDATARVYARLSRRFRCEMDAVLSRMIATLPDIPRTGALERSLDDLVRVLFATGSPQLGFAFDEVRARAQRKSGDDGARATDADEEDSAVIGAADRSDAASGSVGSIGDDRS